MGNQVFQNVGGLRPGRSVFDLSYEKKLTCDMGQLIPVMCDEMVPGDTWTIGNEIVLRFQPLVAPVMHEINVFVHYFFVPYRLLWDDWEDFITGGKDGQFVGTLPRWTPTSAETAVGTLWDYLGFPVGIVPNGATPLSFPKRAYNFIYNEYYRDETLIDEVDLDSSLVLLRAWEKDFFTSSLPWQQRGTAPALPISGTTKAVWPGNITLPASSVHTQTGSDLLAYFASTGKVWTGSASVDVPGPAYQNLQATGTVLKSALDNNVVDLSSATTFNVSDLRLAFQVQKWMERNARAGARYTESLRAHFGVSPRDERLQRPEYVGGSRAPVIVSEVLQTSSTDSTSAQGNQAGHAITVDRSYCAKYSATEYGLMMGIMSVMPRSAYQQGIDRQWLRSTKYDFYFPEFANLSEQAVERAEIYVSDVEAENKTLFGYQGRYDEMRIKRNMVCGYMRSILDYWHLGRKFDTPPLLNKTFIECNPSKRIFAVQDEPGLIVNVGNLIKAVRPLPVISNPGLIDHN